MKAKDEVQWDVVDYGQGVFHVVSYGRAERPLPAKAPEAEKTDAAEAFRPLWRRLCCCPQTV